MPDEPSNQSDETPAGPQSPDPPQTEGDEDLLPRDAFLAALSEVDELAAAGRIDAPPDETAPAPAPARASENRNATDDDAGLAALDAVERELDRIVADIPGDPAAAAEPEPPSESPEPLNAELPLPATENGSADGEAEGALQDIDPPDDDGPAPPDETDALDEPADAGLDEVSADAEPPAAESVEAVSEPLAEDPAEATSPVADDVADPAETDASPLDDEPVADAEDPAAAIEDPADALADLSAAEDAVDAVAAGSESAAGGGDAASTDAGAGEMPADASDDELLAALQEVETQAGADPFAEESDGFSEAFAEANFDDGLMPDDAEGVAADEAASPDAESGAEGEASASSVPKAMTFKIGAKTVNAPAPPPPAPAERAKGRVGQALIPVASIGKRIYRATDAVLELVHRPFAGLSGRVRRIIGVCAVTTIVVSTLAMTVLPRVVQRRDALTFLAEKRAEMLAAPEEDGADGDADAAAP